MKIVHIFTQNIEPFADAVNGVSSSGIHLNATGDIDYLIKSLVAFSFRDVLGLVVFANPIRKKTLELVKRFDTLNRFTHRPIILISDNIQEVWNAGYFKVKYSSVYLLKSEDNSISDIDISRIFTTLVALSDTIYDLSGTVFGTRNVKKGITEEPTMSDSLRDFLSSLDGGCV